MITPYDVAWIATVTFALGYAIGSIMVIALFARVPKRK